MTKACCTSMRTRSCARRTCSPTSAASIHALTGVAPLHRGRGGRAADRGAGPAVCGQDGCGRRGRQRPALESGRRGAPDAAHAARESSLRILADGAAQAASPLALPAVGEADRPLPKELSPASSRRTGPPAPSRRATDPRPGDSPTGSGLSPSVPPHPAGSPPRSSHRCLHHALGRSIFGMYSVSVKPAPAPKPSASRSRDAQSGRSGHRSGHKPAKSELRCRIRVHTLPP